MDAACRTSPGRSTTPSSASSSGTLGDAVVISGRRGEILFWNRTAEKLFGWRADEVAGQTLDVIVPERFRGRHWDGYLNTMSTGQTKYGDRLLEVPAAHRDGATISIAFTVALLTDDQGEVSGVAAVIRDDTERRRERLEAQQRLRSLESRLDELG